MMFRDLNEQEKAEFRQWARANYRPGAPISGGWHPVVQEECVRINAERATYTPDPPTDDSGDR